MGGGRGRRGRESAFQVALNIILVYDAVVILVFLHLSQQLYRTHSTTPGGSVSSSTSGGANGGNGNSGNGNNGNSNPNAAAANASAVALTMQQLQQQQQQMFAAANQQMQQIAGEIMKRSGEQCCKMAKFDPFLSLDCARVEGVGA